MTALKVLRRVPTRRLGRGLKKAKLHETYWDLIPHDYIGRQEWYITMFDNGTTVWEESPPPLSRDAVLASNVTKYLDSRRGNLAT